MAKFATCSNEKDACLKPLYQPWVVVVLRVTNLVALKYQAIDRSAFWLSQSTVYVNVFFAPARIKYKMNDSYNYNRIYNKILDRDWFSACLFVT